MINLILAVGFFLISLNPASLSLENQTWCKSNGIWTFAISGLSAETAPANVKVTWVDQSYEVVPLARFDADHGFAYYETSLHLESTIQDAMAEVPDGWAGKYNLICNHPTGVSLVDFKARSDAGISSTNAVLIAVGASLIFLFSMFVFRARAVRVRVK
jgi:hypothetical protein